MTGYTRNDTTNNISDGNIINASDLDGEFDAIQAAFNNTTGHSHDGTAAEGAPITVTGPAQEFLFDGTAIYPKADNTYDLGKSAAEFKDLFIDGVANIDDLQADAITVSGLATFNGNTVIGNATSDTMTVTARLASNLVPSTNNTRDLGTAALQWKDLYVAGVADINSLDAATVNIDGGVIDSTVIGAGTPAAGTFTTLTAIGNVTLGDSTSDTVTLNSRFASSLVPSTDNTMDLGSSSLEWKDLYVDGVANIDSLVADTADVNGGTIDGAVIGGSTPAAGTFTDLIAQTKIDLVNSGGGGHRFKKLSNTATAIHRVSSGVEDTEEMFLFSGNLVVIYGLSDDGSTAVRSFQFFRDGLLFDIDGVGGPMLTSGTGSPEGVVTARIGSLYCRKDGGSGTTLYVKESGTGNTGWVAK